MALTHRDVLGTGGSRSRAAPAPRPGRARRDGEIVEAVIAGESVAHIGSLHGFTSPGASIRLVDKALDAALPGLSAHQQQRVDLARLDRLLACWWDQAMDGDRQAAEVVLAVIEARAALLAGTGIVDEAGSPAGPTRP